MTASSWAVFDDSQSFQTTLRIAFGKTVIDMEGSSIRICHFLKTFDPTGILLLKNFQDLDLDHDAVIKYQT